MEGGTTCPACSESVAEGGIERHIEQVHPTESLADVSVDEGHETDVLGGDIGSDEPPRKRAWSALLALGFVIVIVTATISILMVPNAVENPLDFSLPDTGGTDWNLGNHLREGKPILIEFIALDCDFCISWVQETDSSLKKLYENYGTEIEFVTIVTSLEAAGDIDPTPELAQQFKTQYGTPWTYLVDNGTSVRVLYGVNAVPTIFIIDKFGTMTWSHVGIAEYSMLETAVRVVL
jgi:thiol-disulfide isomerase/thioredoxin